jgi:hypothetical protein
MLTLPRKEEPPMPSRLVPLVILSLGASFLQIQGASAAVKGADASVVRITIVRTAVTDVVRIRAVAKDLGPDDVVGDSFDVHYQDASGLIVRRERCDLGISPDTPYCEYGEVTVGQRLVTMLKVKIVSEEASVTFCTSYEGATVDPDHSNDCASVSITR